ncbi:MAG: PLP-dependent aminotransferase family protein [Methylobacter sp.]|nr:PLP-dependent aminotransferase family protein [Methylobacter sp.]
MPVTHPLLTLNTLDSVPLVEQIVVGIKRLTEERVLRVGTRLPSIRNFAVQHSVSRFTVVDAYDRLVAMGYIASRRGSGFYVAPRQPIEIPASNTCRLEQADDVLWLLHNTFQDIPGAIRPGCGWLPGSWLDGNAIQKSLHELSRKSGEFLTSYGDVSGYLPLRQQLLQKRLTDIGIGAEVGQIIMTNGATHGLDLAARLLIRPGDAVLIDDPGYYTLFGYLKSLGARLIGVPRNVDGPDVSRMEQLIEEFQPKLFFTNTVLHNPTGTSTSLAVAHQILQLAEKHGLYIVEDDIYGDFHPSNAPRLATLDQLKRVIYVSSFSKTISASLRVGFVACNQELAARLIDLKLLSGLTTSEINQRVMHQILLEGRYRKHIERVRSRLQEKRGQVIQKLEQCGLQLHAEPVGGMFIWARLPEEKNAAEIATLATRENIMLAPGNLFRPYQEPSPWLRFNVAHCDDDRIFDFLIRRR